MATLEKNQIKPNIGIKDANRNAVIKLLNLLLADEHVLYIKTRNFHWHVVGRQFSELHNLFEEQYTQLALQIDEVAERTRTVGGEALGTMKAFIKETRLAEHSGQLPDALGMVSNLLEDHEAIIRHLREDLAACDEKYNDMGTSDFMTGLMAFHEKLAWMLRVFLEQE